VKKPKEPKEGPMTRCRGIHHGPQACPGDLLSTRAVGTSSRVAQGVGHMRMTGKRIGEDIKTRVSAGLLECQTCRALGPGSF